MISRRSLTSCKKSPRGTSGTWRPWQAAVSCRSERPSPEHSSSARGRLLLRARCANLVQRGAAAIPELIAHLDDKRPTKITIHHESVIGVMSFDDEYDYNRKTTKPPKGVNRESQTVDRCTTHTVTVGDLCFVALGQIVNRYFSAVRYQPTACIMINSPTASEHLRIVIKKEWGGLTNERHKESLVRDFLQPDSEFRRAGACLRLGYYYPELLEPLALKQLAAPRYNVFEVESLIREKLYLAKDAKERRLLFDAFVAKCGDVARQGILVYLFEDLHIQEADEGGHLSPGLKEKYAARACLVELFGYPEAVKSKDQPHLLPVENCTQARFIDTLVFFPRKDRSGRAGDSAVDRGRLLGERVRKVPDGSRRGPGNPAVCRATPAWGRREAPQGT